MNLGHVFPAKEIPSSDATVDEYGARALEMISNTTVSNVTGNPNLTIPVAGSEGVPVGMRIVGRQWDEPTVLRVGRAYEKLVGGFAEVATTELRGDRSLQGKYLAL